MKKLVIPCLLIVLTFPGLKAQQIPPLSQYTLNHYLINPGATGTSDKLPVGFTYRKLWTGIEGAPSVQYLTGNMGFKDNMGAGVKIFNFQSGPVRKTGMEATYSYHIDVNQSGTKLSFGLSLYLYQFFLNKSKLTFENPVDIVAAGYEKMIVPDASFGSYLYSDKYFAGLAVPQLFNRNIDLKSDRVLQQKQVRHYYLHGGYIFDLGTDFSLEPSVLLKFIEAGLFQSDINAMLTYKESVFLGLSFRTADAIVCQLGYQNESLIVGYSFDITVNGLKSQASGSHEIMLMYRFNNFLK